MRTGALLAALMMVLVPLSAQKDFHFESFTTRDGLSSNEIRSLLQDSRGFLWVGTSNGLHRFDGYSFEAFLAQPGESNSLGGEAVSALAESPSGLIWITHNRGIDVYDPARDSFSHVIPRSEDRASWSFTSNSSLFISSSGHVVATKNDSRMLWFPPESLAYEWLFPPTVPAAKRPAAARLLPANGITAVTRKSEEEAWVSSLFGLYSLNLPARQFHHVLLESNDLQFGPGPVCTDEKRGLIWFSVFGQGLFSFDPESGQSKGWGLVPSNYINAGPDVALMEEGSLWMSQPGILYPEQQRFIPVHHIPDDPYSFPGGSPTVALPGQDGILWVGTRPGLCKLDPRLQGFRHVLIEDHPEYDYDNSVFEIYDNPEDGTFYITSFYTNRIFQYDPASGRSSDISGEFHPSFVQTPTRIFRDSQGDTWLLANGRLYRTFLKERRLQAITMPALPEGVNDRATFDLEEDMMGNLWIAKWRAGLLYFSRQSGKLAYAVAPPGMPSPRSVYCLATSPGRDTIWAGTRGDGIYGIDLLSGKWVHLERLQAAEQPLSVLDVTGLETDEQSNLWIATQQGLIRRSPDGKTRLFARADGLANTLLEGMGKDQKGRLWLATGSGISSVDPRTLAIRNYDERHGLKIDATLDGFSVGQNGELFSGTKRGFIRFQPDSLPVDERPPRLQLTSFKVNGVEFSKDGKTAAYRKEIRLKPSENFFTIGFTALNFTLPEENHFFFKLEGFNEDWVDAGQRRSASYTGLPPGHYKFCLKVRNKDGIWSEATEMMGIEAVPPFWRTGWFLAFAVSLLIGAVYAGYRQRIGQIRREERMKADFNKKLAEVEMAALRSQMNPHFLFNCLNSINRFIQRNEPDAASSYLTKFSRLIRLVLDNSRSDLVSLRDELEALRLYIELEAMRFIGRFTYEVVVAAELEVNSLEVPPMLVQPYVENAIWHGLMHKESEDCRLWVKVFPREGQLAIVVEDNGIGRAMALQLKSKSATLHKSHGMKVTEERIEMINEAYRAKATLQIEDLKDEHGKAAGTRVTLLLPIA